MMTCTHCHREFVNENEYCLHCGMAIAPSTEAENRSPGDTRPLKRRLIIFAVVIFSLPTLDILRSIFVEKMTMHEIGLTPFVSSALFLLFLSPFFAWDIYKRLKGKNYPLARRTAVILEKRREARRSGANYFITFRFPDGNDLELEVGREAHNELVTGERIIVKYKEFFMSSLSSDRYHFFGYERLG